MPGPVSPAPATVTLPRTRQALQVRSAETSPPGGCITNDPSRHTAAQDGSLQHIVTERGRAAGGGAHVADQLRLGEDGAGLAGMEVESGRSVEMSRLDW